MNRLPSDLSDFLFFPDEESYTTPIPKLKKCLEEFKEGVVDQREKLIFVFKNLLWSLDQKSYSRAYKILALLKDYAVPQVIDLDHSLLTYIFLESMECTLKLFQTVYETVSLYYKEISALSIYRSYAFTKRHKRDESDDLFGIHNGRGNLFRVSFYGNILETACFLGFPKLVEFLLSLPSFPNDCSAIYLSNALELRNPPLLAYAILGGNTDVAQFLLDHTEQADPDDPALQTLALFQLYWLKPLEAQYDISFDLISMKWAADQVFDEVYQFPTLLLPESLETPSSPDFLPLQLSQWVVAQGWIAPLEVLRNLFSTGQYGRKEAMEIIASFAASKHDTDGTFNPPLNFQRRIFGLSGIFLRYVPGIGTEPDFGNFLLRSGFTLEHREMRLKTDPFSLFNFPVENQDLACDDLEEKVMADIQSGLAQMDQPVKLSSDLVISDFLRLENKLQKRILQLLHRTCGVELCGSALTTSIDFFFSSYISPAFSQVLLECCTRDPTPLEHCGWIAEQMARSGSMDILKIALKNGLLEGEPWPEFLKLLNENKRYDLLSIILAKAPLQNEQYSL